MSVSGGSVVIPEDGKYLVSYFFNTIATENNLEVTLYLNGVAVADESINASTNSTASKTILLTVPANSTLSLYNTSESATTFANASLTVIKAE